MKENQPKREAKAVHLVGSIWQTALDRGVNLAIGFIIIWVFSTQEYGSIKIIQNTVSTMVVFSHLGLTVTVSHLVTRSLHDKENQNPFSYLIISLGSMLGVFLVSLTIGVVFLGNFDLVRGYTHEFPIALIGNFLILVSDVLFSFLGALHKYRRLLALQIAKTIVTPITIPLSILFSVLGYFTSILLTGIVLFFLSLGLILTALRNYGIPLSTEGRELADSARKVVEYGYKIFMSKTIRQIYVAAPVILLSFISEDSVAFFSVAYMVTGSVLLFPGAMTKYVVPTLTALNDENKREKIQQWYREGASFIFIAALAVNISLAISPGAVLWLLRAEYQASILHMRILGVANAVLCLWLFDSKVFYSTNRTGKSVATEFCIAVSSIILSILLLPAIGPISVSLAFMFGILVGTVLQQLLLYREFSFWFGKFRLVKLAVLMIFTVVLSGLILQIGEYVGLGSPLIDIVIAASTFSVIAILSITWGIIPKDRITSTIHQILS